MLLVNSVVSSVILFLCVWWFLLRAVLAYLSNGIAIEPAWRISLRWDTPLMLYPDGDHLAWKNLPQSVLSMPVFHTKCMARNVSRSFLVVSRRFSEFNFSTELLWHVKYVWQFVPIPWNMLAELGISRTLTTTATTTNREWIGVYRTNVANYCHARTRNGNGF